MAASRYKLQSTKPTNDDPLIEKIDVSEILKSNYKKQREHEKPLDLSKPKSRRKRDYFIGLIIVNSALIGLFLALPKNVVTIVFTFSGVIFFSTAFTWAMWKVMKDY